MAEIDVRAMSVEEVESADVFASSYEARQYLRLEMSGDDPARAWRLIPTTLPRPLTRTLDAGGFEALLDLYGERERLRFLGAFSGPELAGLATWRLEEWNHMIWLCDIRVREDHRRARIGSRLMESLEWAAFREEAAGIMLETQNLNLGAVEFYRSRGFEVVGLNTRLYPGADRREPFEIALFMHRGLGD